MTNVMPLKGKEAPKAVRSKMETMILTRKQMQEWKVPLFQRPIRVNDKVRALSVTLKQDGGVVPGVITLGQVTGDPTIWLPDGQHRREAFLISELPECIADVRLCHFDSMADMAREFVELNSKLVNMRPDDILRGMESCVASLKAIRTACDFVGYENIRRGDAGKPLLSMSSVLRCWNMSDQETPGASSGTALQLAEQLDDVSCGELIKFLAITRQAWGDDPQNYRLWSNLNVTISMWMWKRMVLEKDRSGYRKYTNLTPDQFRKGLMAVSADALYSDWLVGRRMGDRDRSPCFSRLRDIFIKRLAQDNMKVVFIKPAWATR